MARYYLRDSTPVEAWSEIPLEDLQAPVEDTNFHNKINVTTVFTGFNIGTEDEPKIFETLVHGGYHDGERETYFTEEQAKTGHQQWIKKVSEPLPNDVQLLGDWIMDSDETNPYRIAKKLIEEGKIIIPNE